MYLIQNTRTKNNKKYVYTFLAESRWNKKTKKSEKVILANISHLPERTIMTIKNSLKKKNDLVSMQDIAIEKSIDYGHCFVILEIMKRLKIKQAIEAGLTKEEKGQSKYALLMILGKIVTRGSKLGIVNWIKRNDVIAIELGFTKEELEKLSEKDLYATQFDINNAQEKIQRKWQTYNKKRLETIFLYDITSFYFEGAQNELACFGYNRDKKQGKKIITTGLITDKEGFPMKIDVFKGNTKDETTVSSQLQSIRQEFGAQDIILVGDRGMKIRYNLEEMENQEKGSSEGISYISGLTTSEIRKLETEGTIQMSLFDKDLVEVEKEGKRYVLCVNPTLEREKKATRENKKQKFELELLAVQRSFEKKKAQCETNRERIASGDKNKKLKVELTAKEIKAWEYRITNAQKKYQMQKVYTVTINGAKEEESFQVTYDALAYDELTKFDGKYVFETIVKEDLLTKEEVRDAYKQLQEVEHAFRDMKTTQLNIRPIFHTKEETTRSHAFLGMFSYAVIREMEQALWPWLREQKKTTNNKISFDDVMEELKMVKLCVLSFGDSSHQEVRITKLNDNQKHILSLLNINEKILEKST